MPRPLTTLMTPACRSAFLCSARAFRSASRRSSNRFRSLINRRSAVHRTGVLKFPALVLRIDPRVFGLARSLQGGRQLRAQFSNRSGERSDGRPRPARSRITAPSSRQVIGGDHRRISMPAQASGTD